MVWCGIVWCGVVLPPAPVRHAKLRTPVQEFGTARRNEVSSRETEKDQDGMRNGDAENAEKRGAQYSLCKQAVSPFSFLGGRAVSSTGRADGRERHSIGREAKADDERETDESLSS
jgi:hypothetical protein